MKLQANTQTREVIGQTGWEGPAKLYFIEGKFAVIKVPGRTCWIDMPFGGCHDTNTLLRSYVG